MNEKYKYKYTNKPKSNGRIRSFIAGAIIALAVPLVLSEWYDAPPRDFVPFGEEGYYTSPRNKSQEKSDVWDKIPVNNSQCDEKAIMLSYYENVIADIESERGIVIIPTPKRKPQSE